MNEEISHIVFRKRFAGQYLAALAVFVVLLLLPGISHALTENQKNIVGLKGVKVINPTIEPELESLGLSRDQIKTDVESRLRNAGVRILTKEEWVKTPGKPGFSVEITGSNIPEKGIYVYAIDMNVFEQVTLARGFKGVGSIWHLGTAEGVGKTKIEQVREVLGKLVDQFINDYLVANPK